MTVAAGVLASHPIITAVPFFVPTFVVVAVIVFVVWRDRRRGDDPPGGVPGPPADRADGPPRDGGTGAP
ncbi:hypothetical protein [Actinomadura sp. K4S16]|uniref:hypothetical protein n=1 Tax=Actinomadura sp. K4S16 TaxID=1316147 RepID=UPI0011EFB178|nr:hypothetical protein [Actinomadura sp. K4S16]